eukprot:CAMPEP_0196574890 /NCGR_PEP_ID=MMETSP1081-20130531/4498_1 /TAXON_ID=36882 /ORGANISM="Pyramimonas amylifera, Strain CCMP720" /LENGTH=442 /DNA_ID=CAMNT_0041893033 /DNA_START=247 /DNA_END=1575 /DNA_ORIENTATION=-
MYVCNRASGGNLPGSMGSRLIIPGGSNVGGSQGPGEGRKGPVLPPPAPPEGENFYQPWRRPLDAAPSVVTIGVDNSLSMDDQMQFVRERRGPWHLLAKYIINLQGMSITSELIEENCGVSPREQNLWQVASNVFYSLLEMPDFDKISRQYFEIQGQGILYSLRTLNQNDRLKAAMYCASEGLGEADALELAKALKDYKYRAKVALMEGFTDHCGDVRALKYYREAMQQKGEYRDRLAELGLGLASTEGAKMSLQRLVSINQEELQGETAFATLPVVTLAEEEQSYWPVPVLGTLTSTTRALFDNVPATFCQGPFKLFKPTAGVKMTALPLFGPIATADDPVAIEVKDTMDLDIPLLNSKPGEALLIIDRQARAPSSDAFFLCFEKSTLLLGADAMEVASLKAGRDIAGNANIRVAGKLVLAVRPSFQRKQNVFGPGDAVVDV